MRTIENLWVQIYIKARVSSLHCVYLPGVCNRNTTVCGIGYPLHLNIQRHVRRSADVSIRAPRILRLSWQYLRRLTPLSLNPPVPVMNTLPCNWLDYRQCTVNSPRTVFPYSGKLPTKWNVLNVISRLFLKQYQYSPMAKMLDSLHITIKGCYLFLKVLSRFQPGSKAL